MKFMEIQRVIVSNEVLEIQRVIVSNEVHGEPESDRVK